MTGPVIRGRDTVAPLPSTLPSQSFPFECCLSAAPNRQPLTAITTRLRRAGSDSTACCPSLSRVGSSIPARPRPTKDGRPYLKQKSPEALTRPGAELTISTQFLLTA